MSVYKKLDEIRAGEPPSLDDIIDLAMSNYDIQSERKLAKTLGIGATSLNHWRKARNWPSDATMEKLSTMAGIRIDDGLLLLNYWRTPARIKPLYVMMLHRMGALNHAYDLNEYNRLLYLEDDVDLEARTPFVENLTNETFIRGLKNLSILFVLLSLLLISPSADASEHGVNRHALDQSKVYIMRLKGWNVRY